jgi:DNA polymerase-3 subunit chi
MSELWFYHLERTELERALAPLLEKCLQRGWRALVRGGNSERLDALDAALWTYRDESFLPHAREEAVKNGPRQPVLLTMRAGNLNAAKALFLIDGAAFDFGPSDLGGYERACLMFDGRDEAALENARARWKDAKAAGVDASYWKENASGKWEKQQ